MSRVMELHHDWMTDPAFVQEFKKLEAEVNQLKALANANRLSGAGTRSAGNRPAAAEPGMARKRSA